MSVLTLILRKKELSSSHHELHAACSMPLALPAKVMRLMAVAGFIERIRLCEN